MITQRNKVRIATIIVGNPKIPATEIKWIPIKKKYKKIAKPTAIIGFGNILIVKSEYPQSSSILPEKIGLRYKFHRNF